MGRIYRGQSALRITANTFCDLEGAEKAMIRYRKPDGSTGELAAVVADASKGLIFHEVLQGELDIYGWWVFWAFVTFIDGRTAAGEPAKIYIWAEGS